MQFALVNGSKDPVITRDLLARMAIAFARQLAEHVAPEWQLEPIPVSVVDSAAAAGPDDCLVTVVDSLDDPNDLGFHTTNAAGRPLSLVGWGVIQANGGTLLSGSNALSVTMSHEIVEPAVDPYANAWEDDGSKELAREACDPVESDSYEIDGVAVSNFVGPRYFSSGVGPYDHMGKLTAPWTMSPGGYQILRTGGPNGQVTDVFGEEMPEWKRAVKRMNHTRRTRRHL